ncbi:DinB family protein [candidate division KSB1 bacterium]|nr:DinB family protein [candidate division KSB1 bacterium]
MIFSLNPATEILSRTPSTLKARLAGLSEPWIKNDEGPKMWSPYDVVGHLIHGERTDWMPRLKIVLELGESRPFNPFDRFAQFEASKGKSLNELLETFATLRRQNLATLKQLNLTDKHFKLKGTHPDFGPVTLEQLLATWVVHDLDHISQITRVMAKQYLDEVGPWVSYLSILKNK